jgi:GT2 family glycosyltransferase
MIKMGIAMVLASVEVVKPMNDPFSVSVVVPTYNRKMDLDRCLQSISDQKILPGQVIVVDNGSIALDNCISKWQARFAQQKTEFLYVKNQGENSLTIARNMGITHSTGSLVSFLDDDLVLDKNYYEEILNTFRQYPGAKGVQGYNQSNHVPSTTAEKLAHGYCRFFQVSSFFSNNGCTMLPSLCVTYPYPGVSGIQTCEWMSGASVYRRSIHNEITWDTSLKKYSWNEDGDFSYRVFKKYPGTLYMNPDAKYWHKGSPSGRNPPREIIYASEVYDFYLFFKNIDYSSKNLFIFMKSRVGRLLLNIAIDCSRMSKEGMLNAILRVHALTFAFVHIRKIRRGNLDFFNTWFMGE